ncbi:uncharacterized protein PV07_11880 [Cladophialophora immunda]|uniref:Heme haloperoxidase family profile domain-containing protein n=1 Tax=Cladophialophora immunda TaxID=569365 RepID=A0A0D1Z7S9_9EURO|nr:uncharacterized protein PV07_11880 [Cladophialophora immunda]KIW23701.1 hypothetical protein PV07_11880 [Cladophialophora immunda]OQV03376.1 hypothetical protein CLAIMM_08426 [Cladophialophora immunda]
MKSFLSTCAALLGSFVFSSAFPTASNVALLARAGGLDVSEDWSFEGIVRQVQHQREKRLLVNPLDTPIQVDGQHQWQAPSSSAQRGPCPGLNALANHGYIDRSGVAKFPDVIGVINEVYGMDIGLSTILAVMGTVWTGNPISLSPGFSIDTSSPQAQNLLGNLLGLLGTPRGIGRSHNWIEADASLTRDDLYVTGDASTMDMSRFLRLYNRAGDDTDVISTDNVLQHAIDMLDECIATNPYCYYGPYTGAIARNAGAAFTLRLLSNHSTEYPGGIMTKEIFKSFWGVVDNADGSLQYKRGWERIPNNWFKAPVDYGLVQLNLDLVDWFIKYPQLASIGGNTGTVNSFTGLDISNLSGGILNAETLLEGNNLLCFAFQVVNTVSPDSLSPLYSALAVPLKLLTDALGSALDPLTCPPLGDLTYEGQPIWKSLTNAFAGAERAGSPL